MKSYIDTKTKLSMGLDPFLPFASVSAKNSKSFQVDFEKEFASMILSASGWRKVFVSSGGEEDASESIGEVNAALAVYIAESFAKYIKEATGKASPRIVIGLDARPTGTEIGQILLQVLGHRDISLEYVFISAAPEIMAYAREKDGFVYVSASHNPVGHNGIKFGLNDGGVIPGAESAKLTALFKDLCTREDAFSKAVELYESAQKTNIAALFSAVAKNKEKALASYESFTKEVISGETEASKQDAFLDLLGKSAKKTALSILVDMNGSARAISIDKSFISKLGFGFHAFNDSVRDIVHAIIPEPENLVHCAKKMEEMQKAGDSSVVLGYMPDCDGDRGNIVYWDSKKKKAGILEAQEVFALSVLSELAFTALRHKAFTKEAIEKLSIGIAVNDPTSMRIEKLADAFGARVFRAEVGEANVVNLARAKREEGFLVPILGEGSNGGNITHPAAVRDPLNTLFALLKLLSLRGTKDEPGLFKLWLSLSGQEAAYKDDFDLVDIINTLPQFTTTGVSEERALLDIKTLDHAVLKKRYQSIFYAQWNEKKMALKEKWGIASWRAVANKGMEQKEAIADFSLSEKGGLKIIFSSAQKKDIAFIWMRGSGTEPVFRVMSDVQGSDSKAKEMEKELLAWHSQMILLSDAED